MRPKLWDTDANWFTCAGCGVEFCANGQDQFNNRRERQRERGRVFCSVDCHNHQQTGGHHWSTRFEPLTCAECQATYYRTTKDLHRNNSRYQRNYCGPECRREAAKSGKHGRLITEGLVGSERLEEYETRKAIGRTRCPIHVRGCAYCQKLTTFRVRSRRYCSDECRRLKNIERIDNLYNAVVGKDGATHTWRRLLVEQLRHRDGDNCILCAQPIDFEVRSGPSGSDQGHSIEHVIPRSQHPNPEWVDSYYNLALSHWGCNRTRRVTPLLQARRELCGLGP